MKDKHFVIPQNLILYPEQYKVQNVLPNLKTLRRANMFKTKSRI